MNFFKRKERQKPSDEWRVFWRKEPELKITVEVIKVHARVINSDEFTTRCATVGDFKRAIENEHGEIKYGIFYKFNNQVFVQFVQEKGGAILVMIYFERTSTGRLYTYAKVTEAGERIEEGIVDLSRILPHLYE